MKTNLLRLNNRPSLTVSLTNQEPSSILSNQQMANEKVIQFIMYTRPHGLFPVNKNDTAVS